MCDHNNVSLDSHNRACPIHIGSDDTLANEAIFDVWKVLRAKDCGLEGMGLGIVEALQVSNSLLLLVLNIYSESINVLDMRVETQS